MSTNQLITEIDILSDVVEPDQPTLSPELARELLKFRFKDQAKDHIRELLQKNNAGAINADEKETLDRYLRVGEFLDLMQAKARLTLQHAAPNEAVVATTGS